jgi:hypothetical protein
MDQGKEAQVMQQVREKAPTLCASVVYSLDEGNGAISLH